MLFGAPALGEAAVVGVNSANPCRDVPAVVGWILPAVESTANEPIEWLSSADIAAHLPRPS